MENNAIRFACNGCGTCCKGRLIPLTLNETRQWLQRGHEVAVILEAFDESTWQSDPRQYAHSAQRAVEVLFTDRIVDPVLTDQVERSRQADRDDAQAKIAVCEAMGLSVTAWKGNALAVYLPDRASLLKAIDHYDIGMRAPTSHGWKIRIDDPELRQQLQAAGVALDNRPHVDYIFHRL